MHEDGGFVTWESALSVLASLSSVRRIAFQDLCHKLHKLRIGHKLKQHNDLRIRRPMPAKMLECWITNIQIGEKLTRRRAYAVHLQRLRANNRIISRCIRSYQWIGDIQMGNRSFR